MVMPYHLRKPRRNRQEIQYLTRKAYEMILNGTPVIHALEKVNLTSTVFYKNCKKLKLKNHNQAAGIFNEKTVHQLKLDKKESGDKYKELLKEFLLEAYLKEKGIKS